MTKYLTILFLCFSLQTWAQEPAAHWLDAPDTLNRKRLFVSAGTGLTIYTGFSIVLWEAWYKQSEIGGFRTFDDSKEWLQVDKMGHGFAAWLECYYAFQGAKWTGMKRKNALITASAVGIGLQTTIEVMDGFSKDWGWSWTDVAANGAGVALFASQEIIWKEQRIKMKISGQPTNHSTRPIFSENGTATTDLQTRADDLFGSSFTSSFLKDYNAQTTWLSFNVHSFLPNREQSKFPKWLNVAVGYGAQNLYGGFENEWEEDGNRYVLNENDFPRHRQFYLSFDIELSKLKTKNRLLKALLGVVNWIKIPSPSLEINTLGEVRFHPIYW